MREFQGFGCGTPTLYHLAYPHDKISFYRLTKEAIFKRSSELYEKGYSLNAISKELEVSKSHIRKVLIEGGIVLRSHSKKPKKKFNWPYTAQIVAVRNAPYGFYLSQGKLKPDTREQEIIQKILEMNSKNMSHGAIARSLNDQKIRPRLAKKWSQVVVGFIIKRHSKQNQEEKK